MSEQSLTGQRLGPYLVEHLIGKGGCGSVYQARQTTAGPAGEAGTAVAIKVFHPDVITDERLFQRFEREADLGLRIRHPHIVPTFECGVANVDGATLHYMVMELVEGETLRDVLDELGTVPEDLLAQIVDQVLDALAAVHAEGMVHRDMKPENVILTRTQQVRVMDLGVARLQQEGRDLTHDGEFIGSLAYAAPEQFVDQDHVDPRADIYAVGVLLYEMATGVNPYDEPHLRALIEKKLRTAVRRPRLLNRSLDPFLDEVIQTCLEIEPAARFPSCEELRRVLAQREDGHWWQTRIEGEAFPAATRALRHLRTPRDVALVGRATALESLHGMVDRVRSGSAAIALVSGAAGVGKSRLIHDFFEDLMAPDGPVLLAGRCPEAAGGARSALGEAVRGYLGESEGAATHLDGLLPREPHLVERLVALAYADDAQHQNGETARACSALLRALATERPVVVCVEDLHHAGEATVSLLETLVRDLVDERVLLVLTWRPEGVEAGSSLHALTAELSSREEVETLRLQALDHAAVEALLAGLVKTPRTVRALRWPLMRASAGNPHFLLEIVAHLRETGALAASGDGWELSQPLHEVALPESLRVLLLLRLVDIEPDLMQLLEAASAQGPSFDAGLLASVTGHKRLRLLKRLAVLERRHGVVESTGRSAFRFADYGLWQVIHGAMRPERRREVHALCAQALQEDVELPTGALALQYVRHALEAEQLEDALSCVPAAVEHAATQIHAAEAVAFLERVAAALGEARPKVGCDITLRLARAYQRLGRTEESHASLRQAAATAEQVSDPSLRSAVACERATWSLHAAELEESRAHAEEALQFAEAAGDDGLRARARRTLGRLALRTGDPGRAAEHLREALALQRGHEDARSAANIRLDLASALLATGDVAAAQQEREAALAACRESGDPHGEVAARNAVGEGCVAAGRMEEAQSHYENALAVARDFGDLHAEAQILRNLARVHALALRVDEARATFERALDIFRQVGDVAAEAGVLDELGSTLAAVGDHETAVPLLESAETQAERAGDGAAHARTLRHLANVRHEAGDTAAAWRDFARAHALAPERLRGRVLSDMGSAALREGDAERAVNLLEDGLAIAQQAAERILTLARLARARHAIGAGDAAADAARHLEALLAEHEGALAPQHGPEVYYSLATVLGEGERGAQYLREANRLLERGLHSIRTASHRDHYMTTRWPNREIVTALRSVRD